MKTTITRPQPKFKYRRALLAGISVSVFLIAVSSVNAGQSLKKASDILNTLGKVTSTLDPLLGEPRDEIQAKLNRASDYAMQAQLYSDQLSSFYYNLIAGNLDGG